MARADRLDVGEIHRLTFDVDFAPGHAAAYLVAGTEPLLVDAGTLGSAGEAALASGLADCGYEPADVEHLLVTHPHVDHIGQVANLREVADVTIHAPTAFRPHLGRDVDDLVAASRTNFRAAGVDPAVIDALVPEYRKAETIIRDVIPPSAVDHWIEPGEQTGVGPLSIDPIHTPGHHEPHVCYVTDVGDERVVFSGDMLIEPFRAMAIHVGLDEGMAEAIGAFRTALDRLADAPADRIFPGHGPIHTAHAATIERSRADLDRRLDDCAEKLRPSGTTALHVAGTLSNDDHQVAQLVPEVFAALATLEQEGRARSQLDDGVRTFTPA